MLNANNIKAAKYNPRKFTEENYESLDCSMDVFKDISGITFNKETGNLITGHHRWNLLCQRYGIDNLNLIHIPNTDKYVIADENMIDTGYIIREVSWNLEKEKLANITANADTVTGSFTKELAGMLSSVSDKNKKIMESLRLNQIRMPKVSIPKKIKNVKELNSNIDLEEEHPRKRKSETLISGGGETYITLKLELKPDTAEELENMLERFRSDGDGVEEPLKRIIDFMNKQEIESVIEKKRKRIRN